MSKKRESWDTTCETECDGEEGNHGQLFAFSTRALSPHLCARDAMAPSPPKPWETQQGGGGGATSAALSSSSTTTGIHPATSPATASSGDHGAPALPDRPSSMSTGTATFSNWSERLPRSGWSPLSLFLSPN